MNEAMLSKTYQPKQKKPVKQQAVSKPNPSTQVVEKPEEDKNKNEVMKSKIHQPEQKKLVVQQAVAKPKASKQVVVEDENDYIITTKVGKK